MQRFEFHPTIKRVTPIRETSNPHIKVRVDSTDKTWIHHSHFQNWTTNVTVNNNLKDQNEAWTGLYRAGCPSTAQYTRTVTIPEDGYYRVEIMTRRGPTWNGTLQFYDGTKQIGNTYLATSTMDTLKQRLQLPSHYFKAGTHTFKASITKGFGLAWIVIFKLKRKEGWNQHTNDSNASRLDILSGDFTQNTVSDSNLLNLKIVMKEEYYDDNNPRSLMDFDYNDHITLWLGSEYRDATAMFGGYITDLSVDDEENAITLGCQDRLFDFMRKPVYKNFKIGSPTVDTTSDTTPFTKFNDAYSLIKAVSQCPEYPLATYLVPYDYGVKKTFQSKEECDTVTSTVYRTEWDSYNGKTKGSLKIGLDYETGDAEATLYQDDTGFDAYTYNHLTIPYYTGGAGSKYPLVFNFEIDMYKKGQTVDDAVTYYIHFNGSTITSNLLTSISPKLDGSWHDIILDLRALFNSKAPSSEYWITRIAIAGTVTDTMLTAQRCSTIWIDSIKAYKEIVATTSYASQDVKTPFEELQGACEACNLAAYVQYGDERIDDVLVVQPIGNSIIPESLEEGRNLLKVSDWQYNPLDDGFVNQRYSTYNITDTKYGSTYKEDHDSVLWYGAYQTFEHLDDVNTQASADANASNVILEGAWKNFGATVEIPGCTILQPSQYALSQVGTKHMTGQQLIKSIKHEFKFGEEAYYLTTIDLNRPGDEFNKYIYNLRKDVRNSGNKHNTQSYTDKNLTGSIKTGIGVYQ